MFDAKNHHFSLFGKVRIKQKDKELRCEKIEFWDDTGWLECSGFVEIYSKNEVFRCNFLRTNIYEEAFVAKDKIFTQIIIE